MAKTNLKYFFDIDLIKSFKIHDVQKPDFVFSATLIDPACRYELGFDLLPFSSDKSGCYAFFDPLSDFEPVEVMYVGRAICLLSRLHEHWRGYSLPLSKWYSYAIENDLHYLPFVAIWFIEVMESIMREIFLIAKLNPRFNVHRIG